MAKRKQVATPEQLPGALVLEHVPVLALKPYARNARTHSVAQVSEIAASITEFGWTNPVLISEGGEVIAGHGRLEAAKLLGLSVVPCLRLSGLSEVQRRAYAIADNRIPLNAGWDFDLLRLELKDFVELDFDLAKLGFSKAEVEGYSRIEPLGLTDPDAVPEDVETRCKPGDLWTLGKHRLLVGDSTSADDVVRLFDGERAELCFTSPPYADQREYNGEKELSTQHLATFIRAAHGSVGIFAVNLGLSRKGGEVNCYWDDYIAEARACGLKLLSWNVWDKGECGSIGNQTAMFGIVHEWIFVFGTEPKKLNLTLENSRGGVLADNTTIRQKDGSLKANKASIVRSHRQARTIVSLSPQKARNIDAKHPAMFPVALPESYIADCTAPDDVVYEPFCGSGTTLIACEKTARRCFGMEIDPKYCDVTLKRWEAFTGKSAEKVDK